MGRALCPICKRMVGTKLGGWYARHRRGGSAGRLPCPGGRWAIGTSVGEILERLVAK
jgi:hypothetical protein